MRDNFSEHSLDFIGKLEENIEADVTRYNYVLKAPYGL